jgi:hypothetical protein
LPSSWQLSSLKARHILHLPTSVGTTLVHNGPPSEHVTGEYIEQKTTGSFKTLSKSALTSHLTTRRWGLTQAGYHATCCAYRTCWILLDRVISPLSVRIQRATSSWRTQGDPKYVFRRVLDIIEMLRHVCLSVTCHRAQLLEALYSLGCVNMCAGQFVRPRGTPPQSPDPPA